VIIEISVAVLTLAVVVLIVYVIGALKAVKLTLEQTNLTMGQMQQDLVKVSEEAAIVMQSTDGLIRDVQLKLHAFDPLLESVSVAGEAIAQLSGSAKQVSATVSHMTEDLHNTIHQNQSRIADVIGMATEGVQLYRKIQSLWASMSSHRKS